VWSLAAAGTGARCRARFLAIGHWIDGFTHGELCIGQCRWTSARLRAGSSCHWIDGLAHGELRRVHQGGGTCAGLCRGKIKGARLLRRVVVRTRSRRRRRRRQVPPTGQNRHGHGNAHNQRHGGHGHDNDGPLVPNHIVYVYIYTVPVGYVGRMALSTATMWHWFGKCDCKRPIASFGAAKNMATRKKTIDTNSKNVTVAQVVK
jgi:hypothetical protein